ncbi:MAG: hypothetical protein U9M94_00735 [Patescibacteria group bacterium]|nr:hypothetical protein [Patescibacteria group bacterium]
MKNEKFAEIGDILKTRKVQKKTPAYEWQELALQIIKELKIPSNKRSSVFKMCKQYPKTFILQVLNDTKELCKTGDKWKYFFKIINGKN